MQACAVKWMWIDQSTSVVYRVETWSVFVVLQVLYIVVLIAHIFIPLTSMSWPTAVRCVVALWSILRLGVSVLVANHNWLDVDWLVVGIVACSTSTVVRTITGDGATGAAEAAEETAVAEIHEWMRASELRRLVVVWWMVGIGK